MKKDFDLKESGKEKLLKPLKLTERSFKEEHSTLSRQGSASQMLVCITITCRAC